MGFDVRDIRRVSGAFYTIRVVLAQSWAPWDKSAG